MRWNVFDKTADFYYQLWSAKNRHSNAGEKGWHVWKYDQLNSGRGACAAPASAMRSAMAGCLTSDSRAAATAMARGWPNCLRACRRLRLKSAFGELPVNPSRHPVLINWPALWRVHEAFAPWFFFKENLRVASHASSSEIIKNLS
jgi:hypothetical protein